VTEWRALVDATSDEALLSTAASDIYIHF